MSDSEKSTNNYIPPIQNLCFEHDGVRELDTEIHVHCTNLFEGNTVRIALKYTSKQLVLCEVNINTGKVYV